MDSPLSNIIMVIVIVEETMNSETLAAKPRKRNENEQKTSNILQGVLRYAHSMFCSSAESNCGEMVSFPCLERYCFAWEYMKVPRMAMAAPSALMGWTGVWKIMMEETMTEIRFMVLPTLNVSGEISSNDM